MERGSDRDSRRSDRRTKTQRRTGTVERQPERERNTGKRVKGVKRSGEERGEEEREALLTEAERKTGGEEEGSCRWTVQTSKLHIQPRSLG